jgi:hypothetical protein
LTNHQGGITEERFIFMTFSEQDSKLAHFKTLLPPHWRLDFGVGRIRLWVCFSDESFGACDVGDQTKGELPIDPASLAESQLVTLLAMQSKITARQVQKFVQSLGNPMQCAALQRIAKEAQLPGF